MERTVTSSKLWKANVQSLRPPYDYTDCLGIAPVGVLPISISFFVYISIYDRRDWLVLSFLFVLDENFLLEGSDRPIPHFDSEILNGLNPARVSF